MGLLRITGGETQPAPPEEKKLQRQTTQWRDYAATKETLFCCCLHSSADARWTSVRLNEHQALDCYLHTKADPRDKAPPGSSKRGGGSRRNMTRCIVRQRVVRFAPSVLSCQILRGREGFELRGRPSGRAPFVWTFPGHVHWRTLKRTQVRSLVTGGSSGLRTRAQYERHENNTKSSAVCGNHNTKQKLQHVSLLEGTSTLKLFKNHPSTLLDIIALTFAYSH